MQHETHFRLPWKCSTRLVSGQTIWPNAQKLAAPVSWQCPLQHLQACSGEASLPYSAQSLSRDRRGNNRVEIRYDCVEVSNDLSNSCLWILYYQTFHNDLKFTTEYQQNQGHSTYLRYYLWAKPRKGEEKMFFKNMFGTNKYEIVPGTEREAREQEKILIHFVIRCNILCL